MRKTAARKELTIPMWIDDVKKEGGFKMTRLSYFVAEAEGVLDDWTLTLGGMDVSFVLCGISAAICCPNTSKQEFESPKDIDTLIDKLEGDALFSVETPDIWIPNKLFGARHIPKRGDVYRVEKELFGAALRFRTGRTTLAKFTVECSSSKQKPRYSPGETEVFAAWGVEQLEVAKKQYDASKAAGHFMAYSTGE